MPTNKDDGSPPSHPRSCAPLVNLTVPHRVIRRETAVADAVVTSWQEGTSDKARLAEIAIERLGRDCEPREALLIDNRLDCVDAWQAKGGSTYLFTSDEAFRDDSSDFCITG